MKSKCTRLKKENIGKISVLNVKSAFSKRGGGGKYRNVAYPVAFGTLDLSMKQNFSPVYPGEWMGRPV